MSSLKLRIDAYLESDMEGSPSVPTVVYSLDSASRSSATETPVRTLVPIDIDPRNVAELSLEPGDYYVESMLPSGEMLTKSVTLSADESRDLVLKTTESPNEWFSWQHLMGNTRVAVPAKPRPTRPRKKTKKKAKRKARKGKAPARSTAPVSKADLPSKRVLTQPAIGRPIQLLASPISSLAAGDPEGAEIWQLLVETSSLSAGDLIRHLNNGQGATGLPVYMNVSERAVYRLRGNTDEQSSAFSLKASGIDARRYFAVVPRKSRAELLSLPLPWMVVGTGREATIEIGVQQIHGPNEYSASLTALDEKLAVLLGFLSQGSLTVARNLTELAHEMLFYKFDNPYAAAAGGYAMVATSTQSEDQEWHNWIRNLMNFFPHVPDGAIQWAQLRLKMRRKKSDVDEARAALKTAYRRGLPFYSMGIRWLIEGLEWIAEEDEEATEMLKNVRQVAWLTNFQQPFTILLVGGSENV